MEFPVINSIKLLGGRMTRKKRIKLKTWADLSSFEYTGSIQTGLEIYYGSKHNKIVVSVSDLQKLLALFRNTEVEIGTSRTSPPGKSLGAWLQENVNRTAIASYLGSILIAERYAKKVSKTRILFS